VPRRGDQLTMYSPRYTRPVCDECDA
jgi:hypothetical protein